MSTLQMIIALEELAEAQQHVIVALATRLAELGDVETGRDEIAIADTLLGKIISQEG